MTELEWTLRPRGDYRVWDGLTAWCCDFVAREPIQLEHPPIKKWHKAAIAALRD